MKTRFKGLLSTCNLYRCYTPVMEFLHHVTSLPNWRGRAKGRDKCTLTGPTGCSFSYSGEVGLYQVEFCLLYP